MVNQRSPPYGSTLLIVLLASGCAGQQSALEPAAHEARMIAELWWWMLCGGLAIWAIMIGLTYYSIYGPRRSYSRRATAWVVIGGGVLFPTAILTTLLCFGLSLLPPLVARPPAGTLAIDVEGVQWWWRVNYPQTQVGDQTVNAFETANEICIPVDVPVEFRLHSHDVIHAFWIPAFAGKVDMIPGRTTRLTVHPYRIGRYRGACAEYCGDSHALMNFDVRVLSRDDFDEWLIQHASPARSSGRDADGESLFHATGCGACHAVRGTVARGTVGPDLTHFGSRLSLGAGIFPNDRDSIIAWLRSTEHVKPGVHMPNFGDLQREQLDSLASYLEQLK